MVNPFAAGYDFSSLAHHSFGGQDGVEVLPLNLCGEPLVEDKVGRREAIQFVGKHSGYVFSIVGEEVLQVLVSRRGGKEFGDGNFLVNVTAKYGYRLVFHLRVQRFVEDAPSGHRLQTSQQSGRGFERRITFR